MCLFALLIGVQCVIVGFISGVRVLVSDMCLLCSSCCGGCLCGVCWCAYVVLYLLGVDFGCIVYHV